MDETLKKIRMKEEKMLLKNLMLKKCVFLLIQSIKS